MFSYQQYSNPEKEILIKNSKERHKPHVTSKRRFTYTYLMIAPFLFCLFLSDGILGFVINEWTQSFIQHEYNVNDTNGINSSICEDKNISDPVYENYTRIQQTTSMWIMYFKLAEYVPTLIVNVILLSYTDTFGRRYLFILGSLTMLIKCGIVTLTIRYYNSLIYIVLGHVTQGLSGNGFSLFSVSFTYIADLTLSNRSRMLGIVAIEVVILFSAVISGFLSGYLVETIGLGYFYTAVTCTCLNFVAFITAAFFLPESLSQENRVARKPFLTMIKRVTDFYVSPKFKGLRLCFIILLLSYAFCEITNVNRPALETLFLLGQPFCWDDTKIGNFQLTRQSIRGIFGLVSLPLLQKVVSNEIIAIISILSNMASFIMEGYANTELKIYYVTISGVLSFLCDPMVQGLMSSITPADKQGSMFAGVAVIQVITAIISAIMQNIIYSLTLSILDGFVFLVMAGFCGLVCLLLTVYCCIKPYNNVSVKQEVNINSNHPSNNNHNIFEDSYGEDNIFKKNSTNS